VGTGLPEGWVQALAVSGTNLFAGIDSRGVFLFTSNGTSWAAVNTGLTDILVQAFSVSGANLFAGSWRGGVFLSTNNGTSWTAVNSGLPPFPSICAFAVSGTNLYAGTGVCGVWRRPLSEMITSVEFALKELPREFCLNQNYPNPFNPSTTIRFDLPHASKVSLKVYNVLGQEVTTLVDEEKPAGRYDVRFNAQNLASGMYMYRLQAGEYVAVEKSLLLK
jgi:hypothetical protein